MTKLQWLYLQHRLLIKVVRYFFFASIGFCVSIQILAFLAGPHLSAFEDLFRGFLFDNGPNLSNFEFLLTSENSYLAFAYSINTVFWKACLIATIPLSVAMLLAHPNGPLALGWNTVYGLTLSTAIVAVHVFFNPVMFSFSGMKQVLGPNIWSMPLFALVIPVPFALVSGRIIQFEKTAGCKT